MPEKPVCFDTRQTTVSSHVVIAIYQEFRPDRRLAPLGGMRLDAIRLGDSVPPGDAGRLC
jgi:hypothetical protein